MTDTHPMINDKDPVKAEDMVSALTERRLIFGDGSEQVFTPGGATTYFEHGRPSHGEWWVIGDGEFASFWPPDFRASYRLSWRVERGEPVGLVFAQTATGEHFVGTFA